MMGWPEYAVIAGSILAFVYQIAKLVKDREVTSGGVAGYALAFLAYYAFYFWTLHEGGFW